MGYAFRSIKFGTADVVLTGGADATVVRGIMEGFIMMRVVSTAHEREPRLASRPFSRDRDGFVLAEGSWMFVLEELERARSRGARVYAEIRGYGATCDAHHRVRLDETGEESARARPASPTPSATASGSARRTRRWWLRGSCEL
jgi:3-oxoacyl-[acyl-carrier-protein] synthase II